MPQNYTRFRNPARKQASQKTSPELSLLKFFIEEDLNSEPE